MPPSLQIVERCGRFSAILNPGLAILIPCIDLPSAAISMRLQQIEVACETKTKDNVFTHMKVRVALLLLINCPLIFRAS